MKQPNAILIFVFFVSISLCNGQSVLRPSGKYQIGDTIIEVKYFSELNSVREFKKIEGTDLEYYSNYYMNTMKLKEEGAFKDGWNIGVWKFYNSNGQLEKEINFDTNIKTLYGKTNEPFDSLFNFIEKKADLILKKKLGKDFTKTHVIQNTSRSYFYYNGHSGRWYESPEDKPKEFLMRYDIILNDKSRLEFIEFSLDSLGNLKPGWLINTPDFKDQNIIITEEFAEKTALKNGLTEKDKPFTFSFSWNIDNDKNKAQNLEFIVEGKKHPTLASEDQTYEYVVLNPWTGMFIRKDQGQIHISY